MMRRPAMTGELRRLREFAAAGMTRSEANRALGRNSDFACTWARRLGIVFQRRSAVARPRRNPVRPVHPAEVDLAAARVRQTIDRLRAYQRIGADA
jgi:hypothetical protein